MEKVKITIDGKEIEVEKGKTVLQTALENGVNIPYFCYHPRLKIIGACRMCIAYNEKTGRLFTTCNTPVEDGMVISTKHPAVVENQKYLLQAFMTRHPLDCPICDKAGECDLQNYGAIYGPQKQIVPVSALEKERHYIDWESDFLEYYSNRCVVCYRCTRACSDVVGAYALYVEERGFHANIVPTVRPMDTSTCEMCGLCVYVCPVGAIISKPFKYWTRSWLLNKGKTSCNVCPVGCEIQVEYGVGDWRSQRKVYRTKPTDDLNICAKAFFGYDVLNTNRLLKPYLYGKEDTIGNVANMVSSMLRNKPEETAIVLSSFMTNEELDYVKSIVKATGCVVTSTLTLDLFEFLEGFGEYKHPSIEEFINADYYVLLGDDITSTAPVLSYYMKGDVYTLDGERTKDQKLNPKPINFEELKGLKGKGFLVVNASGLNMAKDWGKRLRGLEKEDLKVYLLHYGANFLGVYERFNGMLSKLDGVLSALLEGRIKNLIIYGEDLLDYYSMHEIKPFLDRLTKLVVFSPFEDGLSSLAHVKIPMGLYGEVDGTISSFLGESKVKGFLPWRFDVRGFYETIVEVLPKEEKQVSIIEGKGEERKLKIHLYMSNWITRRSENLTTLYEKQLVQRV